MSHISRWLGPPLRKSTMHDSARRGERAASADSSAGRFSPRTPAAPTWSTSRRDSRSGPEQATEVMGGASGATAIRQNGSIVARHGTDRQEQSVGGDEKIVS